jgi:hypothetical protein
VPRIRAPNASETLHPEHPLHLPLHHYLRYFRGLVVEAIVSKNMGSLVTSYERAVDRLRITPCTL